MVLEGTGGGGGWMQAEIRGFISRNSTNHTFLVLIIKNVIPRSTPQGQENPRMAMLFGDVKM